MPLLPELSNMAARDGISANVCTTPACIHIASEILYALAPNYAEIDPCSDFDQYACSGWEAKHAIPEGSDSINTLREMAAGNRLILRDILESPYPNATETGWLSTTFTPDQVAIDEENFNQVQSAYNACLNETAIEEAGIEPLLEVLDQIMELFPVQITNSTIPKRTIGKRDIVAMGRTILFFEQLGIQTFQSFTLMPGTNDTTKIDLTVGFPEKFSLPDLETYRNEETLASYALILASTLESLHPGNIDAKVAEALAQQIIFMEVAMLLTFVKAAEDPTETSVEISLEELSGSAPELGLDYVIQTLGGDFVFDRIVVNEPDYFANVSALLSQASPDVVQGFFLWRAITALSPNVLADETAPWLDWVDLLSGNDPTIPFPRWRECQTRVDAGVQWMGENSRPSGLGWTLSRFFVETAYTPEARAFTDQILTNIRQEFLVRLEEKDWIEEETKKVAAEKVNAVLQMVGYPDEPRLVDPQALKNWYSGLEIGDSHFANMLALGRAATVRTWSEIHAPVNRFQWIQTSPTVNAYYFSPLNEIVVPAGIQQFPVFSTDFPSYIAYGSMGSIAGHELTHGFDNNGRRFGPDGRLFNWWTDASLAEYQNRTQCFVEQYNQLTVTGPDGEIINVNGEKTLGENIADAGGLALSYGAWTGFQKKRKRTEGTTDAHLPGLEQFTNEQLFFLRWGQSWCNKYTPAALANQVATDAHSPDSARIVATVANSKGFKEAFNCPVKEPTCELW